MALDTYSGVYTQLTNISNALTGITGVDTNAVFTLNRYSGDIIQDDYGNYTTDGTTTTLEVTASLRQIKDPYITVNPGINEIRTYMEGYLVSPIELDGCFDKYVNCTITQDNQSYSGRFTFIDAIPSSLAESFNLSVAIGQKICGYFERNTNTI